MMPITLLVVLLATVHRDPSAAWLSLALLIAVELLSRRS